MIAPDAAWEIVLKHVRPLAPIVLPLSKALQFCLAEDVRADRDLPPADRSAMDGYAVCRADLHAQPCILRVTGELEAGSGRRLRVRPGSAVRIFTGANVPPGADAVVLVERTEELGGTVRVHSPAEAPANILRRGEDARKGELLLPRGTRLGAAEVGLCAAVGKASVRVHPRPRVVILCTGSELRPIEGRLRRHEIRNSNGPSLRAALEEWGLPGAAFRPLPDRPGVLVAALRRALARAEVVLFTGGVSVGNYDLVGSAVKTAGAVIRFHGVSMKPGKPALYATAPEGRHVFGLPGNPLSALTAFHELALPALRRLAGQPVEACRPAWPLPLSGEVESRGGRTRFHLARLAASPGGLTVLPAASRSSADVVSACRADGVILLPPVPKRFAAGDVVAFRPWRPLP